MIIPRWLRRLDTFGLASTARQYARRTAAPFAVFLLGGVLASATHAAPRWQLATPFGGDVRFLATTPADPLVAYAVTAQSELYGSHDGGAGWELISDLTGALLDENGNLATVWALVADPHDPDGLFLCARFAWVLHSRDGGRHWQRVSPAGLQCTGLAADPRATGAAWVASTDGLVRVSTAEAAVEPSGAWTPAAFPGRFVLAVATGGPNADRVYALVAAADAETPPGLWTSPDGGASWTLGATVDASGGDPETLPRIVVDGNRSENAWFFPVRSGSENATWRTGDGGASWSNMTLTPYVSDLAVSSSGTLLLAAVRGVHRSLDGGVTWQPPLSEDATTAGSAAATPPLPPFSPHDGIVELATLPGGVLAAGAQGIWRAPSAGAPWSESDAGIARLPIGGIQVAANGPPLVVALAGRSIVRSDDQGATWRRVPSDLDDPWGAALWKLFGQDDDYPRTIYASSDDGVFEYLLRSKDAGRTWDNFYLPYHGCGGSLCDVSMSVFALDPRRRGRVYIGGFYFVHFGGYGNYLLRSDDGFHTFKTLRPVGRLAVDPETGLLYGLRCGFVRSYDEGMRWDRAGDGLPAGCTSTELALGPGRHPRIYVGTASAGVFRSLDAGRTFHPLGKGLGGAPIAVIRPDPTNPQRIYAGVSKRGVFVLDLDRDDTWRPVGDGLPVARFTDQLAVDPRHPLVLYAGTDQAIYRIDLAER